MGEEVSLADKNGNFEIIVDEKEVIKIPEYIGILRNVEYTDNLKGIIDNMMTNKAIQRNICKYNLFINQLLFHTYQCLLANSNFTSYCTTHISYILLILRF